MSKKNYDPSNIVVTWDGDRIATGDFAEPAHPVLSFRLVRGSPYHGILTDAAADGLSAPLKHGNIDCLAKCVVAEANLMWTHFEFYEVADE